MTREEKKSIIENSSILGYWSSLGGVEVRKIEDTPDGIKFYVKANAWYGRPTYHIRKVSTQFSNDGAHKDNIKVYNQRLYLDECLRA